MRRSVVRILTFNVHPFGGSTFTNVLVHAEVENTTAQPLCTIRVTNLVISGVGEPINNLSALVDAHQYELVGGPFPVTDRCLGPGEVGIVRAVDTNVDRDTALDPLLVNIAFAHTELGTYAAAPGEVLIENVQYRTTATGSTVRGSWVSRVNVSSLSLQVAFRGANGLIFDTNAAFHSGALLNNTTWRWESYESQYGTPVGQRIFSTFQVD